MQLAIDHTKHGKGTKEEGPEDPDCPCRGTKDQWDCCMSSCGFCMAAQFTDDLYGAMAVMGVKRCK